MKTKHYEIHWDDLTKEAQLRLNALYHENIDLCPLALLTLKRKRNEYQLKMNINFKS